MTGRGSADIVKRSLSISGHRTSVSLEGPFWTELGRVARERGVSIQALVTEIDAGRSGGNLSSALRLHVLESLRAQIPGSAAAYPPPPAPDPA